MSQDQAVDLLAKVFQKLNLTGIQDQQTLRQNWTDQNSCQDLILNNTATTANILGGLKGQYQDKSVFASQDYCRKLSKQNNSKFISQQFISENNRILNQNINASQTKQLDINESVHQSLDSMQPSQNTVQSSINNQNYNCINNKDNEDCIKQAESLLKMFKQGQENQRSLSGKNLQNKLFIQTQTNLPLQQDNKKRFQSQNKINSSANANSNEVRQKEYLATPTNITIISQKQQNSLFQKNSIPLPQQLMKNNYYNTNQKQFKQYCDTANNLQLREQCSQNSQINYNYVQKIPSLQIYDQRKIDQCDENVKVGQNERNQSENKYTNDQMRKNSIKSGNISLSNTNIEDNKKKQQRESMNSVKDYYNYHKQNKTIEVEQKMQKKYNNFDFYSCNDEKQTGNDEHSDVRRKLLQRIEGVVSPISSYKNMQLCTSAENFIKRQDYKSGDKYQQTSERTIDQASGIATLSAQIELKPPNWHRMNSAKALPQKNNSYKFQTVDTTDNSINLLSKRQQNLQNKIQRPNLPRQKIYQNNIKFEQQQQKSEQQQNLTFRHRQNEMLGNQQQKQQQPTQKQQMKQYRYQQDKNNELQQFRQQNGDYESNQDEFISQSNQSTKYNNDINYQAIEPHHNYNQVSQFQTIQERPQKLNKQNFFNFQQNESLKDNLLSIDSAVYLNQNQLFFNDEDEVPTVIMEDFN